MSLPPFHLAFPVHDLAAARAFWGGLMGCPEGRSSDEWIDFDFFGHQIVAHLVRGVAADRAAVPTPTHGGAGPSPGRSLQSAPILKGRGYPAQTPSTSGNGRGYNVVDGHHVPVPHFGAVLPMAEWRALAARLEAAGVDFAMAPTVRFEGQPGEQATMFFRDPSGNAIEIKAMADPAKLFAK